MKRRYLKLAALTPLLAAPLLMTGQGQVQAESDRPLQTAAVSASSSPAPARPDDASLLDVPQLDERGRLIVETPSLDAASEAALNQQIVLLRAAEKTLASIDGYTAELTKRERVDGTLGEFETTQIKLRHQPFSVYMKWQSGDRGREVLFVDGENNGEMLVHPGGWKGRFLPTMSIDPAGSLAMSQSRHSVADAGLRHLIEKHLDHRLVDLEQGGMTATVTPSTFDGEAVTSLEVVYSEPSRSPIYSRTVLLISDATGLPVSSRNYGWTALDIDGDDARLIECYEYRDIDADAELSAADFDRTNRRYNLNR